MTPTAIRVRRLLSGPGYNHHAIEMEAAVAPDEDVSLAISDLAARVNAELTALASREQTQREAVRLDHDLTRERDHLNHLRDAARRIADVLSKHEDLAALAAKCGYPGADELRKAIDDGIPF